MQPSCENRASSLGFPPPIPFQQFKICPPHRLCPHSPSLRLPSQRVPQLSNLVDTSQASLLDCRGHVILLTILPLELCPLWAAQDHAILHLLLWLQILCSLPCLFSSRVPLYVVITQVSQSVLAAITEHHRLHSL